MVGEPRSNSRGLAAIEPIDPAQLSSAHRARFQPAKMELRGHLKRICVFELFHFCVRPIYALVASKSMGAMSRKRKA